MHSVNYMYFTNYMLTRLYLASGQHSWRFLVFTYRIRDSNKKGSGIKLKGGCTYISQAAI